MKLSCPSCGAEVIFKSRSSVFGICSFCNSTLVRNDLNLESLGKMSEFPPDMSPLQIGSTGVFDGSKFEIIGRQRVGWENGSWNEWYLNFDNGRDGWLADAQGFYIVSFQIRDVLKIPDLSNLKISQNLNLNGANYVVDDIREVTCISSQGELPVKSVQGRKSTSVDLVGKDAEFGSIEYSAGENRIFFGRYTEFENLKFRGLREFDGW